jgi:hypothetical protein
LVNSCVSLTVFQLFFRCNLLGMLKIVHLNMCVNRTGVFLPPRVCGIALGESSTKWIEKFKGVT